MKATSVNILAALLAIITTSCGCRKNESPIGNKHNYVVVLDLSDRLLNEGQSEKDSAIIMSVFNEYEKTARHPLIVTSSDRFVVRIIRQKGSSLNSDKYEDQLLLDLSAFDGAHKNSAFVAFKNRLSTTITELYLDAHQGNNSKNYAGVDIWMFFNTQINSQLRNDADNKVVILTDGYFDFNSNANVIHNKNQHTNTDFIENLTGKDWQETAEKDSIGLIPVHIINKANWVISGIKAKNSDILMPNKLEYFWRKWLIQSGADTPKIILDNAKSVMVNEFTKQ